MAEWHVAHVVAPFHYDEPLIHYLLELKYRGRRQLGRAFGLLIAPFVQGADVDALVPVPLHARRLRDRGYNQAVEIARTLGAMLARPVLERGLLRLTPGVSQTASGAAGRRSSVAAAFAARRDLSGLRLAVVDDVVTTGATANALAAALLAAGAAHCCVFAVARTPATDASEGTGR